MGWGQTFTGKTASFLKIPMWSGIVQWYNWLPLFFRFANTSRLPRLYINPFHNTLRIPLGKKYRTAFRSLYLWTSPRNWMKLVDGQQCPGPTVQNVDPSTKNPINRLLGRADCPAARLCWDVETGLGCRWRLKSRARRKGEHVASGPLRVATRPTQEPCLRLTKIIRDSTDENLLLPP